MKKLVALIMCLTITAFAFGCGDKAKDKKADDKAADKAAETK